MKRNLIFLDFDGVLNSFRSGIAYQKQTFEPKGLDEVAVRLIKRLCQQGPAEVVISSAWRQCYLLEDIIQFLKNKGWDTPLVIGKTPTGTTGIRGDEVATFLEKFVEQGNELGNWVCIDDSIDFYIGDRVGVGPYRHNQPFVCVNPLNGFSYENYVAALATLSPDHKDLVVYRKHIEWENEYRKIRNSSPLST